MMSSFVHVLGWGIGGEGPWGGLSWGGDDFSLLGFYCFVSSVLPASGDQADLCRSAIDR